MHNSLGNLRTLRARSLSRSVIMALGFGCVIGLAQAAQAATCVPVSAGLVAWWRGEGNALDSAGTNHAALMGGAGFAPGQVGQGFHLNGSSQYLRVPSSPSLDVGTGVGLTIEAWINPADISQLRPIAEWNSGSGGIGTLFWISVPTATSGGPGSLFGSIGDLNGGSHQISTPAGLLKPNTLQHVALTYDKASGAAALFLDGSLVAQTNLGAFTPQTRYPLYLGLRPSGPFSGIYFSGVMDEVSLYGRALTTTEIRSIFDAGVEGKCHSGSQPIITTQPENQTVSVGGATSFSIVAGGTPRLTFQWFFEGAPLAVATNATLSLNNVQTNQAGGYHAVIANSLGAVTSRVATLTIAVPGACVPPSADLVGWWPLDGDGLDVLGGTSAVLMGNPSFVAGESGQALQFDGANDSARLPASAALNVGAGGGLSIEGWIKPNSVSSLKPIAEWNNGQGRIGTAFWISVDVNIPGGGPGSLFGDFVDTAGVSHQIASQPNLLVSGRFQHVALTYDKGSGQAALYLDGVAVARTNLGGITPQTSYDLHLGLRPSGPFSGIYFSGVMDEMSLYRRALSGAEIQTIHAAGVSGKCKSARSPVIAEQPRSVTTFEGGPATFHVTAAGTAPLNFQWFWAGDALSGATNSMLALPSVQVSQAGAYSVVVTNIAGAVTSSVATLTVLPPASCQPVPAGLVAWWPLDGNGDELAGNAPMGFFSAPQFVTGTVGQALHFDGGSDYGVAAASASLDTGSGDGMTVEAWLNPADVSQLRPIVEWNNGIGGIGAAFWISVEVNIPGGGPGSLFGNLVDTTGVSHQIASLPNLLSPGRFQHVALTYHKGSGSTALFLDGLVVAQTNLGSFTPQTRYPLYFGVRPSGPFSGIHFSGVMDEVSLYGRALTAAEIQGIHAAGVSGKCKALRPPVIVGQPQSVTAYEGGPATFRVVAGGMAPLSYQWLRAGDALAGATNATLVLPSVQASQAGDYSVFVTNLSGSVTSAVATLIVLPPATCVPVPEGLVAWWSFDGNLDNLVGPDAMALSDAPAYSTGKVQQGLALDEFGGYGRAPASTALNVGQGPGLTMEAWINPSDAGQMANLLEWNDGSGGIGAHFAISVPNAYGGGPGCVFANLVDSWGVSHQITSAPGALVSQVWQHVAVAYDKASGQAALFVNGNAVAVTNLGSFTPQTSYDLYLGARSSGPLAGMHFGGMVDEVSLYSRALSASEIASIAATASAGKCKDPRAPVIFTPPQDVALAEGGVAQFGVVAGGSNPLAYQWIFNGTVIVGSINASLVLSNVHSIQAGSYAVVVTNPLGSVTSSVAVLTVQPPALSLPTITVQPVGTSVAVGSVASLFVTAAGSEPLSYQWFWNGAALSGANSATLVLTNMQPGQAGSYHVVVSNHLGLAVSRSVVVNVSEYVGGSVNFANLFGSVAPYVYDVDGITKLASSAFLAQLYAGTNENALLPIGAAAPFMTGDFAGVFLGGSRYIPSVPPGGIATIQVRAWEAAAGPTFDDCINSGGKAGASSVFTVHTGGGVPPMPPTWLLGLQSFSLQLSNVSFVTTNGLVAGNGAPVLLDPQLVTIGPVSAQQQYSPGLSQAPSPLPNGRFTFTIWGEVGKFYIIERSSDLKSWVGFTNVLNTAGPMQIIDPTAGEDPQRFYRVRTQR